MASPGTDTNEPSLDPLFKQVGDVALTLKENRDKVLEREGKLNDIEHMAGQLNQGADRFYNNANQVKRKMWWENMKMKICIGVSVGIIIIVAILILLYYLDVLTPSSQSSHTSEE